MSYYALNYDTRVITLYTTNPREKTYQRDVVKEHIDFLNWTCVELTKTMRNNLESLGYGDFYGFWFDENIRGKVLYWDNKYYFETPSDALLFKLKVG